MKEESIRQINEYLRGIGYKGVAAERMCRKVTKYPEIGEEFVRWLELQSYAMERPIVVRGWTAAAVAEAVPQLDGLGVYNLLTDLRDNPEEVRRALAEGFEEL